MSLFHWIFLGFPPGFVSLLTYYMSTQALSDHACSCEQVHIMKSDRGFYWLIQIMYLNGYIRYVFWYTCVIR
jgi:hypothetical protein